VACQRTCPTSMLDERRCMITQATRSQDAQDLTPGTAIEFQLNREGIRIRISRSRTPE
jgi:hypothetical protein